MYWNQLKSPIFYIVKAKKDIKKYWIGRKNGGELVILGIIMNFHQK